MSSSLPHRLRPLLRGVSRARRSRLLSTAPRPGSSEQAHPRAGFYDALTDYKLPPQDHTGRRPVIPEPEPEAPYKTIDTKPADLPDTPEERARVVFGSSLSGPARRADQRSKATMVAGVMVPPKPSEPDNCCMSGCVNCVWDQYREDMEDWIHSSAEADQALRAQEGKGAKKAKKSKKKEGDVAGAGAGADADAVSMDDDGGGSETNWPVEPQKLSKDFWDEELYKNVPVGIREFMKQEKKLKEKHARDGTRGG